MTPEVPLQGQLFTGELIDTRSPRQKQVEQRLVQPRQSELFSARDVAHFGVNSRPLLPLGPGTTLRLTSEDPRTPEEKERDAEQQAQEQTYQLFDQTLTVSDLPGKEMLPIRVETVTSLEGITRHYLYRGDELIVMTPGAMQWQAAEVEAQRQDAELIAAALNAKPVDKNPVS
jgi:hypothetical protein